MALVTVEEAKTILGITGTTYDTQLTYFLPLVEKDIVSYLGHAFQDKYVAREGSLDMYRGDSDTHDYITDDDGYFATKGFLAGMDIAIEGGYSNVGLYTIESVASTKIILTEYERLITQVHDADNVNHIGQIEVSRVKWPPELKLSGAKMAWYLIDNAKVSDATSERLDDYAITYAGANAYPNRILNSLDKFKRPVFG